MIDLVVPGESVSYFLIKICTTKLTTEKVQGAKIIHLIYTVGTLNPDFDKNMLLLKNPQYLPDHYETLTQ